MTTLTGGGLDRRATLARIAPVVVVALCASAVRTPLASHHPSASLLLFLWIVADTLMLSLVARSPGRPRPSAVLGALAGASVVVWLGSPPEMRVALGEMPVLWVAMAVVVLAHAAWASVRAARAASGAGMRVGTRLTAAASVFLPPALVRLAAAELTVIHMALFRWGGPSDVPADARAFAYHRHLAPMCAALLILSAIEVAVYHLLLGHWSRAAALVMFVLSDVGCVYLVGVIKSFRYRPVLLTPEGVRVRAGLLIDRFIPLDAIVAVEGEFTGEDVRDAATLNAALLAWPNVMLRLDRPLPRRSFRRPRGDFRRVAFRLDDPEAFTRLLAWRLGQAAK